MGKGHTRNSIPKMLLSWEPESMGKKVGKHLHIVNVQEVWEVCVCVCVYTLYLYVHRRLCAREPLSGDINTATARA